LHLLKQDNENTTEKLVKVWKNLGVTVYLFNSIQKNIEKSLLEYKLLGVTDHVKTCFKEIGEDLRRALWPGSYHWVIQKTRDYSRPYHSMRFEAMRSKKCLNHEPVPEFSDSITFL
jgi:hypothetical protein